MTFHHSRGGMQNRTRRRTTVTRRSSTIASSDCFSAGRSLAAPLPGRGARHKAPENSRCVSTPLPPAKYSEQAPCHSPLLERCSLGVFNCLVPLPQLVPKGTDPSQAVMSETGDREGAMAASSECPLSACGVFERVTRIRLELGSERGDSNE